jgi:hypothetical protein
MSLDALPGLAGSGYASIDWTSAAAPGSSATPGSARTLGSTGTQGLTGTQNSAGTQGPAATQDVTDAQDPTQFKSLAGSTKLPQPVMKIPAQPLSPTVLAELIGRQLTL